MKKISRMIASSLLLTALLGAGCGQEPQVEGLSGKTVADQYGYSQGQQPPVVTPPSEPTPEPAPVTTSTPEKPPTASMPEALAFPGVLPESETKVKVRIATTLGDIVVQLDPKAGPNAASNFVYLVKKGFYNGTIFHRVIPGFMVQGGDPNGTGMGGPGYQFANDPVTGTYTKGTLAMANAGPNTNGSQFFIMVDDVPLPPDYSVFGKVISGQEVADKISMVERSQPGRLDRPITEVKMTSVTIE